MNRSTRKLLLFGLLTSLFLTASVGLALSDRSVANGGAKLVPASTARPNKGDAWRRLAWLDENGAVPAKALQRAVQQKLSLAANSPAKAPAASLWIEQGPSNLAGRTCCLVISPTSPLTMWMGSAGGGVWRSYDGGTTWNPVGDQLKSLAVNALTLDPNNSNTLYAGTGEGYGYADAQSGYGIFKSVDGGSTWSQLAATAGFTYVNRIAIDPSNSQIILATVETGGIYRSADGGATWKQVYSAQIGHAVVFCPSNNNKVIGTVLDFNNSTQQWFASALVSNDAGATWSKATGGLNALIGMNRIEPAPVVTDATTTYASATDGNIWKSTDGGASYTVATQFGSSEATLGANAIWVDPTNPLRVVVGGQYIYSSTDGGVTLNLIGEGSIQTTLPHPGIHWFVASPKYDGSTNKSLYVCTSGGVFQAVDITTASVGVGWLPHYQTARTSQYYSVAGDSGSGLILGGVQDNGTQLMSQGLFQSNAIGLGDGGFVAIDPTNVANMYFESGYLQVFQTTDTGLDTQPIVAGLSDAGNTNINYIAPLILDPGNPKVLLAGGNSLWRCSNAGSGAPVWSAIRPPDSAPISAIAVAPQVSDLIWVGQNDGTISMTANGTSLQPTWTYINGPKSSGPLPNRYVTRILVDPSNSNVVYVTLGGFTSNNVWETTDSGVTWTPISGSGNSALPQVPVRTIARNPSAPNNLYVGTEVGVFSTLDGGQTWSTSSDLNVNVAVDELKYMNNSSTLLAATHGRGIWILEAGTPLISSLTLSPTTVQGGTSIQGSISLSQVASGAGATISLTVNSTDAQVPATITIPTGQSSANFTVTTNGVSGNETLTLLATLGASQKTAAFTINPPVLTNLSLIPATVVGGNNSIGNVTLSGEAPPQGLTVQLQSNASQAMPPTSVNVSGGAKSANFTIATSGVSTTVTSTISAIQAATTFTATLTIQPSMLQAITLSPSPVAGGNLVTATVALNGDAPFGGTVVKLSSNSKSAPVPATLTVPNGSFFATFSINTSIVTTVTTATITATQGQVVQTAALKIQPATVQGVTLNPPSVTGGSTAVVTGTVTFSGPAPGSGATILLGSSNAKAASVPSSVKIPSGKTSAKFTVTHFMVSVPQTLTITASSGGSIQTTTLVVNPYQVASVTLSPASVIGGKSAAGIVTLNATVGTRSPSVAVQLFLNSVSAKAPNTVSVRAGASTAKFTVTTTPVAVATSTTLTAAIGSSSSQANLTVQPPTVLSLVLKTATVKGSSSTAVIGTVTLTGPAPTGGLAVALSSSNTGAATTPATVIILAGKTSATFTVSHKAVTTQTTSTITAAVNGTNKSQVLTITQ